MSRAGRSMSAEEFRRHGRAVVEWIARYMEEVERYPVLSQVRPGQVAASLPAEPPREGEAFECILADLDRVVMPGITHWQHPGFFAYFPANADGASILGDLVSAGLGVQGMLWATSPACTEVETVMMEWMASLLALPGRFRAGADGGAGGGAGGGVIQDTASSATLCALLAARERRTGFRSDAMGMAAAGARLRAYASQEAHSSFAKAARIAGLGADGMVAVACGPDGAMDPAALDAAMRRDAAAGWVPCMVGATVGTTGCHAMDPLPQVGEVARRHGAWLHVDAAHAGSAAICPEFRWILDGVELADSLCINPHKWLGVNFDCDCFWVADRAALVRTLSILPEYLRNAATESGAVTDYRDWQIPLGRRFRALKLWFVIRHMGAEGLQALVRNHVALAQEFRGWVEADPAWEVAGASPLSLVCFRHRGGDTVNERILAHVNASGRAYLSHTRRDGRFTLRLSVGSLAVERRHVEEAWRLLQAAGAAGAAGAVDGHGSTAGKSPLRS